MTSDSNCYDFVEGNSYFWRRELHDKPTEPPFLCAPERRNPDIVTHMTSDTYGATIMGQEIYPNPE